MSLRKYISICAVSGAFIAILAFFPAGIFAGEDTVENDQSTLKHSLSVHYGPAIFAEGSVLTGAGAGLQLLEDLINTGVVYSPIRSETVDRLGPVYKIDDISVYSNQIGIDYSYFLSSQLSMGVSLKYSDIYGQLSVPSSYIEVQQYIEEIPGYNTVTNNSEKNLYLVGIYQIDGSISYYFDRITFFRPYVRFHAGYGQGWLARYNAGPRVQTIHAGLGLGSRLDLTERIFLLMDLNYTAYAVDTEPSSQIRYTKVLVNPGDGNIALGRINFGGGFRFGIGH